MKFIAKSNQFYICDERYIEGLNIESTLYQNHNLSKTNPISYNITIPQSNLPVLGYTWCECAKLGVSALYLVWVRYTWRECAILGVNALYLVWVRYTWCECAILGVSALYLVWVRYTWCEYAILGVSALYVVWVCYTWCECEHRQCINKLCWFPWAWSWTWIVQYRLVPGTDSI